MRKSPVNNSSPEGSTIKTIIKECGIPKEKTLIIMVNGRGRESDFVLKDGDTVALFPPIGGG
ncbi:MAG: MoaD/ThiS family protein [Theionarchaea archaeon]|nr:MoaD/ThiS family protein [Theionarchaea archaeon]